MDLSQYAELFLAESREHLSACNQLLLDWERSPAAREPVQGLFRAIHTIKGMAATMGYARVAELAHRMESLLDTQRRSAEPPSDELLQLLFRSVDLLEAAVTLSVTGREDDVDVGELDGELDRAVQRLAPGVPRPAAPPVLAAPVAHADAAAPVPGAAVDAAHEGGGPCKSCCGPKRCSRVGAR